MRGLAALGVGSALLFVQTGLTQMGAPGTSGATGSSQRISLPAIAGPLATKYKTDADRILQASETDDDGYVALTYLCDHIGKRLSGTAPLNTAVTWGAELMRKAGLQNVTVQPVMVPHWVRGDESGAIFYKGEAGPMTKSLHMLGLGMSVGTPKDGITAEVIFAPSFAAFDAMSPEQVKGKIVVFNPGWHGYGANVMYRALGPSKAAAKGAVAVLVRSATGLAMQTPHTGALFYDPKVTKIPAAAISVEDAAMIERLCKDGTVKAHLQMDAHMEPDVQAGNVMGEIVGTEHPEQVVSIGGHIDSWDVGQGAQDDGSGIMAAYQAVTLLHKLGLKPKRTIRLVFWVNEENGEAGGKEYRRVIGDKIGDQVAAIEMDEGAEKPLGMGFGGFGSMRPGAAAFDLSKLPPDQQQSYAALQDIASLLAPIGADKVLPGGGGSDIEPLTDDGVPALAPRTDDQHYFDWHHTEADTLDKVDPVEFRKNAAMLSVVTFVLADMDGRLTGHKSAAQ
ncbi:M20/M25/M40 family metallo-hydrolase [Granulicella sp. S190]|uniref:M20/M25/M40 family metallo-hydrolase n=1 Tax=Granulicella sp. S190 TaxID=1747226 RepID=UPI00131BC41D|nr:M20/M25/M40 family metallo-hydrolase [Granulicella sp. S190]